MVAVALLKGDLVAEDYENDVAADPRIDRLRAKMVVSEDTGYSAEYHATDKRSIANALEVFFTDGSSTGRVEIRYPVGHRRRRDEGIPLLEAKFRRNLATRFDAPQAERIAAALADQAGGADVAISRPRACCSRCSPRG